MRLLKLHPEVATRDCQHCLKFLYDAEGHPVERRGGTPETPLYRERDELSPADCRTAKGCPKGTAESPVELNDRNWRCLEHHRECQAVGRFPDDDIVKRNARIIQAVDDEVARRRDADRDHLLVELIKVRTP